MHHKVETFAMQCNHGYSPNPKPALTQALNALSCLQVRAQFGSSCQDSCTLVDKELLGCISDKSLPFDRSSTDCPQVVLLRDLT